MTPPTEIKRVLREAGLEVYRTEGGEVHLAERVRENLIMDSGVRVAGGSDGMVVALITRAQQRDFPGERPEELFERARKVAAPVLAEGYRETRAFVTATRDPGDATRTLDHSYEVRFEKAAGDLEAALGEVRRLLAFDKTARR